MRKFVPLLLGLSLLSGMVATPDVAISATWRESLVVGLAAGPSAAVARVMKDFPDDRLRLEIVADWIAQDGLEKEGRLRIEAVWTVLEELGPASGQLRARFEALAAAKTASSDPRWAELYLAACELRRAARLGPHRNDLRRIVFTKHYDLGGSHYAYTEGQSDAQRERHFTPGAALCVLEMEDLYGRPRTLLEDRQGVIRDPDVSYDGRRVLFAWKKSLDQDDYHLYEMNVEDGQIRQITSGLGFADYEGVYLPSGDILFNSTRCVQTVDCWWTEVSNLFVCDGQGRYLRQLSFDQVHTNYPTVTHDGRLLYTRWDYNDRGQIYPQGLFTTNPDGTGQTEVYGNNSWFPTTILHARSIPDTSKIVCIFTGHHSGQKGWLGVLDPRLGRQENQGAQLIAPVRDTPAVHVDAYGQAGDQFQYPYPLDEKTFLVTFRTEKAPRFGIYLMTIDGRRELLAADPGISCSQPVPLRPRAVPPVQACRMDYRKQTGTVYLHDVCRGPGLEGIPRDAIKALRVVALEFRAAGIGSNGNSGPAGGAMISTPISIQGAWDVKRVLGTVRVHPDGSACFTVPARTPLYFQALDAQGQMVQSMRSWVSLQPGESVSCVGCHENKNTAPPVTGASLAMKAGPQALEPFYGPPRGFSFIKEIQPILDKRCVGCHHVDGPPKYASAGQSTGRSEGRQFDPQTMCLLVPCEGAAWRYRFETPEKGWIEPKFDDSAWGYGLGGFGVKGTPGARVGTEWKGPEIWIRRQFELPEGFDRTRLSLLIHHDEDVEVYFNGRIAARTTGYLTRYELMPIDAAGLAALATGTNTLAVHCRQTSGGQFIDVGIVDTRCAATTAAARPEATPKTEGNVVPAFSLKGTQMLDPQAERKWSDAYKALADRRVANWINVQSAPPMLPPYSAGASQSRLIEMLRSGGHYGVKLTGPELDRLITWIDLLVPYVGDYTEAMNEGQIPRYRHFLEKRERWQAEEAENIRQYAGRR